MKTGKLERVENGGLPLKAVERPELGDTEGRTPSKESRRRALCASVFQVSPAGVSEPARSSDLAVTRPRSIAFSKPLRRI